MAGTELENDFVEFFRIEQIRQKPGDVESIGAQSHWRAIERLFKVK